MGSLQHIHGVGFDGILPERVFIATHSGLFATTGGGVAERVSADASDYMGFSSHPVLGDLLFASGHPQTGGNLGFIASRDGGNTWTNLAADDGAPMDFHAIAISRANPDTIFGTSGGLQVSRDGGATWNLVGPFPEQVIDIAASAEDVDRLYAGTAGGLWRSDDGGVGWQLIGAEGVPATMVEVAPDGALYVFFAGSGLFKLPADGNWIALAADASEDFTLHLAADPADPAHLVAATRSSRLIVSMDGGANWTDLGS
jgi:photosystem II stability/assembly factor-like uncharacterized protein